MGCGIMDLKEYFEKQDELQKEINLKEVGNQIKKELETKGYHTNISINSKDCLIELLNNDQVIDDRTIDDFEEITSLNFQKATPNKHKKHHLEFVLNPHPRYFCGDLYDIEVDNPEGEAIVLTPLLESEAEQLIQSVSIIEDYLKYQVKMIGFTNRVALMNICNFKDEVIKSLKDGEE